MTGRMLDLKLKVKLLKEKNQPIGHLHMTYMYFAAVKQYSHINMYLTFLYQLQIVIL